MLVCGDIVGVSIYITVKFKYSFPAAKLASGWQRSFYAFFVSYSVRIQHKKIYLFVIPSNERAMIVGLGLMERKLKQ